MKRIQRKRTKGWKMPEDAIYVGRPTMWGNPFQGEDAADRYRRWLDSDQIFPGWLDPQWVRRTHERESRYAYTLSARRQWILAHLADLRGKPLACWCPLDRPCHADVLREMANRQ